MCLICDLVQIFLYLLGKARSLFAGSFQKRIMDCWSSEPDEKKNPTCGIRGQGWDNRLWSV